jgi:hypothetical protein
MSFNSRRKSVEKRQKRNADGGRLRSVTQPIYRQKSSSHRVRYQNKVERAAEACSSAARVLNNFLSAANLAVVRVT